MSALPAEPSDPSGPTDPLQHRWTLGLAAFLALVAANAHVAKKVLEAHYDLRRHAALMQDTVENLREELLGRVGN